MEKLPPLNPLRAFDSAARLLSVRQAAQELHVTPAAVSKQIRVLETYLGIELFIRSSQKIKLTAGGEKYHAHISAALNSIRHATREARELRGKRTLNIRAYTTFSMHWLIPRLSSFHTRHPEINIELTTSLRWIDFDREDVDAAIRLGDGNWPGLQADPLVPNILIPACSPEVAKVLNTVSDLRHQTLLHTLARPDDWRHWLASQGENDIDAYSGRHYESSVLVYQAAIQGQGVAMAQKVLVEPDIARGALVPAFRQEMDMGIYTYYFVVPDARPAIAELEIFRDWLLEQSHMATAG